MSGRFEIEVHDTFPVLDSKDRTLCTQPLYTSQSSITIEIDLPPGNDPSEVINGICGTLENLGLVGPS